MFLFFRFLPFSYRRSKGSIELRNQRPVKTERYNFPGIERKREFYQVEKD